MIKPNVMFRQYDGFGYITDNALFGYRKPGDGILFPGERFVSKSGAVMLGVLNKTPRPIECIAQQLFKKFKEVDFNELMQDASDFYDLLVEEGFLSRGATYEECQNMLAKKCLEKIDAEVGRNAKKSDSLIAVVGERILLKSIHIECVTECNERCVHCYIPHKYKTNKMDSSLLFRILEEARSINVINITLSGGEPLLHSNFTKALARLRELDMSVNVLSNLTLLTDAMVEEMAKNPLLSVQTSIYSMFPETHDAITGVKGSFEKTLRGLGKLQAAGIPLQISCPIMQQNKDSFADVVSFGEQRGIQVATDYVIFASYDHTRCNLNSRLSLDDIANAFDRRATDSYVSDLRILAKEKIEISPQAPICSVCRYYMCISATGEAYPCVGWQGNIIGDAKQQTLAEIWEASSEIQHLRNVKWADFPKCAECADRGFCTVCMMANANEDKDADAFKIAEYHCEVASLLHKKVDSYP